MSELDVVGTTERGGIIVERPECIAATEQYTVRSRWATNVNESGTHTTYHISVNAELDGDELSVKPFGGEAETFTVAGGRDAVPADHDDPSPECTIPIEVADERGDSA